MVDSDNADNTSNAENADNANNTENADNADNANNTENADNANYTDNAENADKCRQCRHVLITSLKMLQNVTSFLRVNF